MKKIAFNGAHSTLRTSLHLLKALPVVIAIGGSYENASAQSSWTGASTEWLDAGNWSSGLPNSSTVARFEANPLEPGTPIYLTIGSGTAKNATASALQVWFGLDVNINMTEGSSLIANSPLWRIGYSLATPALPSAPSSLTFTGPASGSATVSLGQLQIGASGGSDVELAPPGGHRLTFSGPGLTVQEGGTTASVVGRFGNSNRLEILNGANVTRHAVEVGSGQDNGGKRDNQLLVNGPGSFLTVRNMLTVGSGKENRSNIATVESTSFTAPQERATIRAAQLTVGLNATNLGGNVMRLGKGGTLQVTGATQVVNFAQNGGDNDGHNRLVIEEGGVFQSGGDITNNGLIALHAGGVLEGRNPVSEGLVAINLVVNPGGRLELAGAGLGASVTTKIQNSRLAVGVTPEAGQRSDGELLTLQSQILFNATAGGALEMTWFGDDNYDSIDIIDAGALTGGDIRLELNLGSSASPSAGQEWVLFSGNVSNITANFDLSLVDRLIWDTSLFNADGGWRIVAIPEPNSLILTASGLLLLSTFVRRRLEKAKMAA